MLLEANNVSKVFRGRGGSGPKVAVRDANMRVRPGQFVAIVGESGSGKSTLARLLLNLLPVSGGSVNLDGVDISTLRGRAAFEARRKIQAVLQDPAGSLNPRKSVEEAIGEVIRLHGVARHRSEVRKRIEEVLELVEMTPAVQFLNRYPHELSGGQRQRVLIARAISLDPQIIIADEAVSALDASVKAGVLRVMADLQHRLGVGYVFITHDLPVVKKVAEYVYVMRDGEIVEDGPKEVIFGNPKHPYTKVLLGAAPVLGT